MKNLRALTTRAAAVLSLLLLSAVACFAQDDVSAKLSEYVNALVKAGKFNGSVLVARDGRVLLRQGYGMANFELDVPNTPQTKFRIGSMTKPFTAAAVLMLQERGKLSVQDSVCKYLTDCPAAWQPVRLHHLLSHTSGLAKHDKAADYLKTAMLSMTPAQLIDSFRNRPADFKPGERFDYNNNGYVLLGHVVERASAQSYETFVRENIFAPLGMNSTGYDRPQPLIKFRAAGYVREGERLSNAVYIDQSQPFAAGALYSTVEDLFLWDQAMYAEKLLARISLDAMFAPVVAPYAYGWFVSQQFNRRALWHGGGTPGFAANIVRFPEDKVTVIMLSNLESAQVLRASNDLAAIVFGEKYETPGARVAVKVDPKIFAAYVGQYEVRPGRGVGVAVDGDALTVKLDGQPDPFTMSPESETRFFHPAQDMQVEFVKDDKGQVTHLVLRLNGREFQAKKIK